MVDSKLKKRLKVIYGVVFICGVVGFCGGVYAADYIINGGFESSTVGLEPDGWTDWGGEWGDIEVTTVQNRSGAQAALIISGVTSGNAFQDLTSLPIGAELLPTAWVYIPEESAADKISLSAYVDNFVYLSPVRDWWTTDNGGQLEFDQWCEIPAGSGSLVEATSTVRIGLNIEYGGTGAYAYFDDVSLKLAMEDRIETVLNGTFDSDPPGSMPEGWGDWGGIYGSIETSSTYSRSGGQSLLVSCGTSSGNGLYFLTGSEPLDTNLRPSAWVYIPTGTTADTVAFGGTVTGEEAWGLRYYWPGWDGFERDEWYQIVAPAGMFDSSIFEVASNSFLFLQVKDGGTGTGACYFDDVSLTVESEQSASTSAVMPWELFQ